MLFDSRTVLVDTEEVAGADAALKARVDGHRMNMLSRNTAINRRSP
jgi:hypothetical protein